MTFQNITQATDWLSLLLWCVLNCTSCIHMWFMFFSALPFSSIKWNVIFTSLTPSFYFTIKQWIKWIIFVCCEHTKVSAVLEIQQLLLLLLLLPLIVVPKNIIPLISKAIYQRNWQFAAYHSYRSATPLSWIPKSQICNNLSYAS